MKSIIILSFILFSNILCQIDPNDYYPLHIGDKWEYFDNLDYTYFTSEVSGDTLMPNGKKYFIILGWDVRKYWRVENNKYVKTYNPYALDGEDLRYDLCSKKGTIFSFSMFDSLSGFGIYDCGIDNNNLINAKLEWRYYCDAYILNFSVPPDTVWMMSIDVYWPRVTNGIGITSTGVGRDELVGAIINKVGYGTLSGSSIKENTTSSLDFELYQNYPNPFNPVTHVKYNLRSEGYIKINVFNSLGKEVKQLYEGFQNSGEYTVVFEGQYLPSGTYFIKLECGKSRKTIKALLLK